MTRIIKKSIDQSSKLDNKCCLFLKPGGKSHIDSIQSLGRSIGLLILVGLILTFPIRSSAVEKSSGQDLFIQHCSGCHVNGGNIIRRGKTLKLKALERNGLDDPQAIARVARNGVGSMSGYKEILGEGGDQLVANWIWKQAQNAWIQG